MTVDLDSYFGDGVGSEEQLDAALAGIREECSRHIGAGKKDSARMILEPMLTKAPTNKALGDRMEKAK